MARLLRVRDRLLFGIALMGDVFDEVRLGGGYVPSSYKSLYGFVPENYKRQNMYASVSRMLRTDLIDKVVVGGEAKFRLTSSGKRKFTRDFPLINLQNKEWDRRLRIIVFDIPETEKYKRDVFRLKLKELGFGMIQRSVWVSPHPFESDMREFIRDKGLGREVLLFVSGVEFVDDLGSFIESVWGINSLEDSYLDLLADFSNSEKKSKDVREFVSGYTRIVFTDPFLPRNLLPKPWVGDEVRMEVKRICKNIKKRSN